jgi:hypothetical protein
MKHKQLLIIPYLRRIQIAVLCILAFGSQSFAQTLVTFNNISDLTTHFSQGLPATLPMTNRSDLGLGNSACIDVQANSFDIWTTKAGYSVSGAGDVYELSAYFKNRGNGGYGALGFSTTVDNTIDTYAAPVKGLGMSFHGGGGMFVNNRVRSNVNWTNGGMTTGTNSTWYKMILKVTAKGSSTYDINFQIWNSDANGVIGTKFDEKNLTGVVNTDIGSASTLHVYFAAAGNRMEKIDDFSINLSGGATIIDAGKPVVVTSAVSSITGNTASCGGNVTNEQGAAVTAKGVCWSTTAGPTITDSKTTDGTGTGTFTSSISSLSPNTTYYVRAYATNSNGTSYGSEVSFTTSAAVVPTAGVDIVKFNESDGMHDISLTKMLFLRFTIPACSNYDLSELGVNIDATSSAGKVKMAIYNYSTQALLYQTSEFSITGGVNEYASFAVPAGSLSLPSGNYAVAIIGSPTSGTINIKAKSTAVNIGLATDVSTASHGKYKDIAYPTFLEPLAQDIVWYRAISVVVKGINQSPIAPTVTTAAISAITKNSAISGGNVTADGGASVIARGVCWNTTGSPTITDSKTSNGQGLAEFTSNISGLALGTKYYVRSYATNCTETSYGEELTFTTIAVDAPSGLSYFPNPVMAFINTDNINLMPTITSTVDSYSISPELPAGITLNTTTGVISGIPTVLSDPTNYTVTATNVSGSTNAIVGIAVIPLPVLEISAGATTKVIGSGPAIIDPALVISGVPRNDLYPGAVVYFNPGFIPSEDQLIYPTVLNGVTGNYQAVSGTKKKSSAQTITADFNPFSGVLTLNGIATVAQYEAIFRSIQYQNTNAAAVVATRSVTFQLGPAQGVRSIQLTLSAPLATAAQAVCGSGTVANLVATAPAGSSVRWYTVSTNGTALANTTALVAGKYYAESWDGTTASPTRTEITLTINVIPAKPLIAGQSTSNNTLKLCPGDNIVCSNFNSALSYKWKFNGSDIVGQTSNQYKVPVGGAGSYSLYVKNASTGCENISETITVQLQTVTIPVVFEKKKSDYISILVVDNTDNLYTAYRWTYADGSPLPAGIVANRQFLVLPPSNMNATYMVNITDVNACTTNSASKAVALRIVSAKAAPTLNNGNFMVNVTDGFDSKMTVRIFNQSGVLQRVFTYEAISSQLDYQVNAAGLTPGMYTVEIGLGDYKQIQKIVIK